MDKRAALLIGICLLEIGLRAVYKPWFAAIDPLLYTLLARLLEGGLILGLALDYCGLKTRQLMREILLGAAIAAGFGALVLCGEGVSRLMMPGGVLKPLLAAPSVANPLLYFVTGCVIAPFVEELFFRGLFYSLMRERLPMLACVFLSALFFASMHGGLPWVQLVGGLMFASLYEWRRNVWAPFVLHAAANFGIWVVPLLLP